MIINKLPQPIIKAIAEYLKSNGYDVSVVTLPDIQFIGFIQSYLSTINIYIHITIKGYSIWYDDTNGDYNLIGYKLIDNTWINNMELAILHASDLIINNNSNTPF